MPTKYKKMLNQQGAHTHTQRLNRLGKPLTVVGKSEREREGGVGNSGALGASLSREPKTS